MRHVITGRINQSLGSSLNDRFLRFIGRNRLYVGALWAIRVIYIYAPNHTHTGSQYMKKHTNLSEVDRIIHEPARLQITAILYVADEADFLFL